MELVRKNWAGSATGGEDISSELERPRARLRRVGRRSDVQSVAIRRRAVADIRIDAHGDKYEGVRSVWRLDLLLHAIIARQQRSNRVGCAIGNNCPLLIVERWVRRSFAGVGKHIVTGRRRTLPDVEHVA